MPVPLQHHSVITGFSEAQLVPLLRDVAAASSQSAFAYFPHPESPLAYSAALHDAPAQVVAVVQFRVDSANGGWIVTPELAWPPADPAHPAAPHPAAELLASNVVATIMQYDHYARHLVEPGAAPAPAPPAPVPPAPASTPAPTAPPPPPPPAQPVAAAPAFPVAAPPPPPPPPPAPAPAPAAAVPPAVLAPPPPPPPPAPAPESGPIPAPTPTPHEAEHDPLVTTSFAPPTLQPLVMPGPASEQPMGDAVDDAAATGADGDAADQPDDDLDLTVVAPRRPAPLDWVLVTADGVTIELEQYAVIGRKPAPPAGLPAATIVTLPDPERMLSKTHALVELGPHGAWVTDLGSTNGTEIVEAGVARECAPHQRITIPHGAKLQFGGVEVTLHRGEPA